MKKISDILYQEINEANAVSWFKDFLKKTSNFIDIWQKKGGTKYKVDLAKGTIQANSKDLKLTSTEFKAALHDAKIYQKCYPKTNVFIGGEQQTKRPEGVDKGEWDNISVKMYVYTPKINYNGENYPVAMAIIPQKKLELLEGYMTLESFEISSMIANKDIRTKVFEIFIDDLRKTNTSANGIVVSTDKPANFQIYHYKGKGFEPVEVESEKNQKDDKQDEKIVDKNQLTVTLYKLDF